MKHWWLSILLIALASPALAADDVARATVRSAATGARLVSEAEARPRPDNRARVAAREAAIGLALYAEGEDFRAISALQRYRLLDGTPRANYLSRLVIGHIYSRNEKYRRARQSYERAAAYAADQRTWVDLLAVEQSCIGLSLYFECRRVYDDLLAGEPAPRPAEIARYQSTFVDVVLRKPEIVAPRLENDRLREGMNELMQRDRAFDELDLQAPWLAGLLSAALPGAGQFYNGAWLDGVLALGLTGGLGVATWYTYSELDSVPGSVALGLVTVGFYLGNIVNAVTDAHRLNAETYRDFFESLRSDLWPRVSFVIEDDRVIFGFAFDTDGAGNEL